VTVFCLIRHAATGAQNRAVSGRSGGIHLSADGRAQAERLGSVLKNSSISALYSSPLERAVETANCISTRLNLALEIRNSLTEVDYGNWTGAEFSELTGNKDWQKFNSFRSGTRIPGGDSILDVQSRVISELDCLRARHFGQTVAAVSHAEPIRVAICYYAGIPLDLSLRIEIEPASLSVVALGEDHPRILAVNSTYDGPAKALQECDSSTERHER
jgi:broad specificity phosphatase PhoE